ncbi:hypothetical protein PG990_009931 [Apiospora arundinis]|uniref:Very low-density lipoprotein receptor n=1 Tax=Apiospora arundinis TaxID=335852 RepID=A0ABR2IU78_9PEZI
MRVTICRPHIAILLAACLLPNIAITDAYMKFVSPPEGGLPGNYTGNSRYAIGERMEISWVQGSMDEVFGPTEGLSGEGKYSWIVGTSKNLAVSEVFYFELQVQLDDGSVKAGPKCHYFNIVTAAAAASMASSRSLGVSSSSSRVPTTMTASGSGFQTAATATRDSNPAGGISTSAKIGLGVAIPAAALVGMLMGWAVFRNCRRENSNAEGASGTKSETSIRESQSEQGYDKHELPAAPRRTVKWIVKSELPG